MANLEPWRTHLLRSRIYGPGELLLADRPRFKSFNSQTQVWCYGVQAGQILIWVLIKIKISEAATITIADQPRINRDPNGVNRGRVEGWSFKGWINPRMDRSASFSAEPQEGHFCPKDSKLEHRKHEVDTDQPRPRILPTKVEKEHRQGMVKNLLWSCGSSGFGECIIVFFTSVTSSFFKQHVHVEIL